MSVPVPQCVGSIYLNLDDMYVVVMWTDQAAVAEIVTIMSCMLLLSVQAALENLGVTSRVQTAIEMREVAEPYIRRRAIRHLENNHVVIFGAGQLLTDSAASFHDSSRPWNNRLCSCRPGSLFISQLSSAAEQRCPYVCLLAGTGNPYFTTDTAAALRAAEVQAEVFLKATKVDGVYTCDPVKHPDKAQRYERLSYRQVTNDELQVGTVGMSPDNKELRVQSMHHICGTRIGMCQHQQQQAISSFHFCWPYSRCTGSAHVVAARVVLQ